MSHKTILFAGSLITMFGSSAIGAQSRHMDFHPSMSPSEDQVVYYSYRGETGTKPDVFVTDLVTGTETNISGTPDLWEIEPQWSPDGNRIVFSRGPDMAGLEVVVLDLKTGVSTVVDSGLNAAWSPSGDELVYMENWGLRIASTVDGQVRRLDLSTLPGRMADPAWSPDAKTIYFSVQQEGGGPASLHSLDLATGEHALVLEAGGATLTSPSVTPDGTTLIFGRAKRGEVSGVYSLTLGASEPPSLVAPGLVGTKFFPTLSPTGTRVLTDNGNWTAGQFYIFAVSVDDSSMPAVRLTQPSAP